MLSLELLVLGLIFAGVTLYGILGGADFGAGIWELNLAFQCDDDERTLINKAMGPVWEANHVWLIFVVVLLFTAFPMAFKVLTQSLWIPLFIAVGAIAIRGVGFVFRSYSQRQQQLWTVLFAIASAVAPFFLGALVGAVASGKITLDHQTNGRHLVWLSSLSIYFGFYAVALCSYLAAVFLVREATRQEYEHLIEPWRRRALATGAWMGVLSFAGLGLLYSEQPALWQQFQQRAFGLVAVSLVSGSGSLAAIYFRRTMFASILASLAVTTVIWGLAVAQFPYIIPPDIDFHTASAPKATLKACVIISAAGAVILLPSLLFLFHIFKAPVSENKEP